MTRTCTRKLAWVFAGATAALAVLLAAASVLYFDGVVVHEGRRSSLTVGDAAVDYRFMYVTEGADGRGWSLKVQHAGFHAFPQFVWTRGYRRVLVPLWAPLVAAGIVAAALALSSRRHSDGRCSRCGYPTPSPSAGGGAICPECGKAPA